MTETVHPVFEAHREAMKAAISHRFDHAEVVVCERAGLPATDCIRLKMTNEFETMLV